MNGVISTVVLESREFVDANGGPVFVEMLHHYMGGSSFVYEVGERHGNGEFFALTRHRGPSSAYDEFAKLAYGRTQ